MVMQQASSATEPRGLWLYAICQETSGRGLRSLTGVGGGAVAPVTAAGLTAVAEDVSLTEFGEHALRTNLEDMEWLEATARAHHTVIDALARQAPVMPMRLATVYSSEAGVRAMLAERSGEIEGVLGRISGRSEWGLKAFAVAAADRGPHPAGPPAGRAPGAGTAYLRRRRDQLSAQQQGRRQAVADAEHVHDVLSRLAVAARLHVPQAQQLTGTADLMVLNAAYLVDDQRADGVRDAVARMSAEFTALRLELTGPWPPYSFAEMMGEER